MKKKITAIKEYLKYFPNDSCARNNLSFQYDKAVVSLPNGTVIEGKVQSWKDYEDGDQIQVKIDGVTYLVHSTNVVLIAD